MIPEAAVEAAACWLPHSDDCEVRPERDCTCWQQRVDIMRAAVEAAAPHMLAGAWDRGMSFSAALLNGEELTPSFRKDNPYRPAP